MLFLFGCKKSTDGVVKDQSLIYFLFDFIGLVTFIFHSNDVQKLGITLSNKYIMSNVIRKSNCFCVCIF